MELGHTAILWLRGWNTWIRTYRNPVTTSLDLNHTTIQHGDVLFEREILRTLFLKKYFSTIGSKVGADTKTLFIVESRLFYAYYGIKQRQFKSNTLADLN